jgi:DNA-binding HxlR family transcriptional regulator
LLAPLQRPAFNIAGLRRADLTPLLDQCSPAPLTRQLARLHRLHVIKRVVGTYRYYLTRTGRAAIAAGNFPSLPRASLTPGTRSG